MSILKRFRIALEEAATEQSSQLLGLREELHKVADTGDDAAMFEVAPCYISTTATLGAYRYALALLDDLQVEELDG